jgi:hypothetical protein
MYDEDEIVKLRASLKRCLEEAESWIFDARGCKPEEVIGYDGWADEARKLLDETKPRQRTGYMIAPYMGGYL